MIFDETNRTSPIGVDFRITFLIQILNLIELIVIFLEYSSDFQAPFTLLRFCYDSFCCMEATRSHFFVFVQKQREKHPFCPITLIREIINTDPNISVFVRSHYAPVLLRSSMSAPSCFGIAS